MHDKSAKGVEFFKCDFCHHPWAEDRPMIEGHHGSLICAHCLTVAYTAVALHDAADTPAVDHCAMCLEERHQPGWRSPIADDTVICLRCIKQGATTLEKDPDSHWRKPTLA